MNELSVLIGGKAGFGIDKSSLVLARILGSLGYRLYIYRDYPSLIRGGHTFSIIRSSEVQLLAHKDRIDILLALDQKTLDEHRSRIGPNGIVIYDSGVVKEESLPSAVKASGIPVSDILKEESAGEIMKNACILGAFCKAAGIEWPLVERIFTKEFGKESKPNIQVARRGYDAQDAHLNIAPIPKEKLPIVTGNEAVSLGLLKAGLDAYISYPMTPTSPILHFMASMAEEFGVKVIHPENEIAVILMALGMAYCGKAAAVGTSGGGFCLMTEGLSFAGMAELPVVIILGQRPGPSTGLPTYSCQTELHFALAAGQGEFARFVIAPGDTEEAYFASQLALKMSWRYQIPSIILTDKTLGESSYSFDSGLAATVKDYSRSAWDRQGAYKRYADTDTGVSPLAYPPDREATVKVNSYEHDEYGISTEDPGLTKRLQDKRLRKEKYLEIDLESIECVKVYGKKDSKTAILSWGSNKGVSIEVAERLGIKAIYPLTLWPFPLKQFAKALIGVDRLIAVESNSTAQLVKLINRFGFTAHHSILKYDGRPFGIEELEERVKKVSV